MLRIRGGREGVMWVDLGLVLAVVEVAGEIGGGSWLRASVMEAQLVRESDHVLISGIREDEERMDCLGNYAQAAVKRLLG